jgi:hypothetical protein
MTGAYNNKTEASTEYMSAEIMGGLGNHLFQIAAVLAFHKHLKEKKQIVFKKAENLPNLHNLPRKTFWDTLFKNKFTILEPEVYDRLFHLNIGERHAHIYTQPFDYCPHSFKLCGYYQSFNYSTDDIRQQMITLLNSNKELIDIVKTKYAEIKQTLDATDDDMVSIHIRRTDFIYLQTFNYILQFDYYTDALKIVNRKKLVIFSDDIEWCRQNISTTLFPYEAIYFVDTNNVEIEFLLMSLFKHNIIANSTFSVWASFISQHKDKIIIAPKNWYGPTGPKEWQEVYHKYITHII